MKKYQFFLIMTIMGVLILTGCAKTETPDSSSGSEISVETLESSQPETTTENLKETSLQEETDAGYKDIPIMEGVDFSDVVSFIEQDPSYDPEEIAYRVYVENVMLQNPKGDERTEVIVCSEILRRSSGMHKTTTIGAEKSFFDSFRSDSPYLDAKEEWCDGYYRYPAELIIEACMDEYQDVYGNEDLQLYQEYELVSTFTEDDWVLYEEYDNSQNTETTEETNKTE